MKSLTLQVEKSANEVESCCKLSLEDSLRDLSFALKRQRLPAEAVETCIDHFREHSSRTFAFFWGEYRTHVGDLASRIERLEELFDQLEGRPER